MSSITGLIGGGGGGLTPKFQEFNSSGTFTPSAALIAAGGYIEVFLVAGGAGTSPSQGGAGGEVLTKTMYLNSTSSISITIGSGGSSNNLGGNSSFAGSSAGGINLTAKGGGFNTGNTYYHYDAFGAGWGGTSSEAAAGGSFGYGAGGQGNTINNGGIWKAKPNSGQGGTPLNGTNSPDATGGSGYCLVKWYE